MPEYLRVEAGQHVLTPEDGLVHVVRWATHRQWDSFCEDVYECYQPAYHAEVTHMSVDALEKQHIYRVSAMPDRALLLQVAPDDATVTCVRCMVAQDMVKASREERAFDEG